MGVSSCLHLLRSSGRLTLRPISRVGDLAGRFSRPRTARTRHGPARSARWSVRVLRARLSPVRLAVISPTGCWWPCPVHRGAGGDLLESRFKRLVRRQGHVGDRPRPWRRSGSVGRLMAAVVVSALAIRFLPALVPGFAGVTGRMT